MAKYSPKPSLWWERAYEGISDIEVTYELQHGKDTIVPGTRIKVKNQRGEFLFRCVAKRGEGEWFDCIGPEKQWHSFRLTQLKGMVKPRKFRRKKSQ